MRHGKVKRLCCLILTIALVGSCFMQYTGTIRAADDEPGYDPAASALKYSKDTLEIGASSSYDFGVTIPENQTYYMSFTLRTDGDLYLDYRGVGKVRLYLGQSQYGMIGLVSELWPQGDFGLKDGARITFRSETDKTTLWVNGEKTVENAELKETGLAGVPTVSWSSATSLMTDIKIWVDEPVYGEETGNLLYSGKTVEIGAGSSYDFGVTIPENQTYYMSFTLKTDSDLYLDYRGVDKARLYLGQSQYGMIGLASDLWPQGDFGLKNGAKITFRSDPDKTTLWINGQKVQEDLALSEAASGLAGTPKVSWASAAAQMTDVFIWTLKDGGGEEPPVSDEPQYNEETDQLYEIMGVGADSTYADGVLTVPASSGAGITTGLPGNAAYYMTMQVQIEDIVNIGTRSGSYINIQPSGYELVGTTNDGWVSSTAFANIRTNDGVKITVRSDVESLKVWADGEKIIETQYSAADLAAAPDITWSFGGQVTAKNIQIWTAKDGGGEENPPESDEPQYNQEADQLYEITGVGADSTYADGVLTVPASSGAGITTELPGNAAYYMTMQVQIEDIVNIGTRSGSYINIQPSGYELVGTTNDGWVSSTAFANIRTNDGVKITVRSDVESLKVWADGEKIIETQYSAADLAAAPDITWSFGGQVTAKNIQIWTAKDGGGEENPPESDEPQYNQEADQLYEITGVGADSTYTGGVLSTADSAAAGIITDLAGNAEYYMTMRVKLGTDTAGTPFVNIGSRGAACFQIQTGGYQLIKMGDETWTNSTVFSKIQTEGVRVTMHSTAEKFQLWADGVKIVDTTYVNANESAKPDITWNQGGVILSDIRIWTAKGTGGDVPIGADEPTCGETDMKYEIQNVTNGTYEDGVLTVPEQSNSMLLSDLPYNAAYYATMKVKTAGAVSIGYRDDANGFIQLQSNGYNEAIGADPNVDREWHDKSFPTLSTGARITIYSSMDVIQIWVDGEKIVDRAYDNGGSAAPALTWTFSNSVEVSDICVWTKENPPSDEPKYDADKHELHEITGVDGGTWKNGVLSVEAEGSSYFNTDLDADSDYYMSYIVQTENYVNISYRSPDGQLNIQSTGYQSIGTDGIWVNKSFPKLGYGLPVTVHSTPDWITIWLNGEKIIDEAYTRAGESKPGISWSFADTVMISDVKIWSIPGEDGEYAGEIGETAKHRLSEDKNYGVALKPAEEKTAYVDSNPVGVNAIKEQAVSQDAQCEVIPTDIVVEKEKTDYVKASIPIVGAVVLLGIAIVQLISTRKKKEKQ